MLLPAVGEGDVRAQAGFAAFSVLDSGNTQWTVKGEKSWFVTMEPG